MFAPALISYEIFANQIKFQKLDLEHEGQGQLVKVKKENCTCAMRLKMFDSIFFSEFLLSGNIYLCKKVTHTHTHTNTHT